jgi:uncharacterized membrane protein YoaK (UPF0700 family)
MNNPPDATDTEKVPPKSPTVVNDPAQSVKVRDLLVGALSFASGSIDGLTYLALGGIFASFMSGNTIFLGLRIAEGNVPSALQPLDGILGYIGGVALAANFGHSSSNQQEIWPESATKMVVIEFVLLAVFAGAGFIAGNVPDQVTAYALIALASVAMGIQSAVVYALRVYGVMTTAISATLTGAVVGLVDLRQAPATKRTVKQEEDVRAQIIVLLLFVLGAVAGGLAETRFFLDAGIIPVVVVGLVIVVASLRMR